MSHCEKTQLKFNKKLGKPTTDNNISSWEIRIEACHKSSYKI